VQRSEDRWVNRLNNVLLDRSVIDNENESRIVNGKEIENVNQITEDESEQKTGNIHEVGKYKEVYVYVHVKEFCCHFKG